MIASSARAIAKVANTIALVALATLLAFPTAPTQAEVTQDPPEKVMIMMMEAAKAKSYADFVHEVDDKFRASLTTQMFEGVSNQIAPRLRAGYKAKYLGKLNKQGLSVYLRKLEFTDGKDDILVTMAVQNKKVAGFLVN